MQYEITQGYNLWWQMTHKGQGAAPLKEGMIVVTDPVLLSGSKERIAVLEDVNVNQRYGEVPTKNLKEIGYIIVADLQHNVYAAHPENLTKLP